MDITNNIAIITGGGSGLGAATAIRLARMGAKVAVLDINENAAAAVAKEINGIALSCDVSNPENVTHIFDQIKKTIGVPRICINCAGIAPAKRIVGKEGAMPLNDFIKPIEVNLIGTFNILRVAATAMSKLEPVPISGERGVIINTASIAAFEGQIGQAGYSASKGGVVALTLPAARELSQFAIRVMTIAPGLMATPMLLAMPNAVQESLANMTPFPKRFGDPDEYAKLAVHIIENVMLNGSVIRLDGALRMQPK